jgi:hypothetical protein
MVDEGGWAMVSLGAPIRYQLMDREEDPTRRMNIRLHVDSSGSVERLTFGIGDGPDQVFTGSEISSIVEADGIRATVVLEAGGETATRMTLEVIVPIVVVGSEPPEEGPFGIFAAGLRIKHFPGDGFGPRQELEAIALPGRAIAHHPD